LWHNLPTTHKKVHRMIDVQNLTFTYPRANQPTIKDISFTLQKGNILGFLGPSGTGKSTTQKILIGLLRHYSGQISILNKPLRAWGSDLYEHIGVSFETPNHFAKLTALENLYYFRSLYSGETESPERLLEMVNLGEDGHQRVGHFSKGMRIRLTFARALLHKPELLFLDEPTAGLDPINARMIKDSIRQQKEMGKTIFLTTHNMSVADELCDHVAFMVDGEIVLIDTPRDLKLRYGTKAVRVEYHQDQTPAMREFPLQDLGENEAFLALLRTHRIETIHTQETTLEKIFLQVTGRTLS
jgi:fluoroquinolone transport system ATP-binding protein